MSDSLQPYGHCLPGSSVHGILQASVLEWVAISFTRGSSRPRNQTQVSLIGGRCFTTWATREVLSVKARGQEFRHPEHTHTHACSTAFLTWLTGWSSNPLSLWRQKTVWSELLTKKDITAAPRQWRSLAKMEIYDHKINTLRISSESACNEGDLGLIPGSGRSPGEGNGNPLQHSCLENPMDRAAW